MNIGDAVLFQESQLSSAMIMQLGVIEKITKDIDAFDVYHIRRLNCDENSQITRILPYMRSVMKGKIIEDMASL